MTKTPSSAYVLAGPVELFDLGRQATVESPLPMAAIVLWNTVYLERSVQSLKAHGQSVDDALLTHMSPLGWEHINLTGDYAWRQSEQVERDKFRPLRPFASP